MISLALALFGMGCFGAGIGCYLGRRNGFLDGFQSGYASGHFDGQSETLQALSPRASRASERRLWS